jgi:hypothetical protein
MPNDLPMKDPQNIWQNQPTEPMKMSPTELRHKALKRQSRARFAALLSIILGITLCVVFAGVFARAQAVLARIGWGLESLWCAYFAYHGYKWMWPRNLAQDAPISTCLEFYRRELEKRLGYVRHNWWRTGLPLCFLGLAILLVGEVQEQARTGAQNAPPHALLNAVPLFVLLAVWVVAYFSIKKKQADNLQQEIEELRAFERDNR